MSVDQGYGFHPARCFVSMHYRYSIGLMARRYPQGCTPWPLGGFSFLPGHNGRSSTEPALPGAVREMKGAFSVHAPLFHHLVSPRSIPVLGDPQPPTVVFPHVLLPLCLVERNPVVHPNGAQFPFVNRPTRGATDPESAAPLGVGEDGEAIDAPVLPLA